MLASFALILAIPLSACGEGSSPGFTREELAKARLDIAAQLRDPESAYFRNVTVRRMSDGSLVLCGHVAGKNGFGGYGDAIPFAHTPAVGPQLLAVSSKVDKSGPAYRQLMVDYDNLCGSGTEAIENVDLNS